MNSWVKVAAASLACAVILGAFGAHGLKERLDAYSLGVYEKAVFYHFIHALGMLIVAILPATSMISEMQAQKCLWLLLTGTILFSGSLYLLAITGIKILGAITPLGGICFILAWAFLALKS